MYGLQANTCEKMTQLYFGKPIAALMYDNTTSQGQWTEPIVLFTETADAQYPWWQSKPVIVPANWMK